jgi:hypothetical protein
MFHAILRYAAVLLALAGSIVTASASETRVALVIGNAAYRNAAVLANPKNDALDVAAAAQQLGFKVIVGIDLDKTGMDRTVRQFAQALKGASVGMFFYAGHGLQVGGRNFLVPIDAELKTAEALDFEMVGLDVVQRIMEAATETNILFVDACRDNPLSRNLARAMGTRSTAIGHGLTAQEAGAGTLISFSTQPGNVALDGMGRNSPYAAALVKHINAPGKDLPAVLVQVRRDVMAKTGKRQIPWEHSALTAEVVLASPASAQTSAAAAPQAEASKQGEGNDASPDPEPKLAMKNAPQVGDQPEASTRKVVKVGVISSTLKIINNKNNEFLYNENGRKILIDQTIAAGALPPGEAVSLAPGRYQIKSDANLVTVRPFDLKNGESLVIDFQQHVGSLRILNNKDDQHLFTESGRKIWIDQSVTGKFNMGAMPSDKPVELPPGRYELKSGNPRAAIEPFEIKAGDETVIDFGG